MGITQIVRGDGSIIVCDDTARTLSYYRYRVGFTPIEWKILKYLYAAKGAVVSRKELVTEIWGADHQIPTRTIDVHVSAIRHKLVYLKGSRIDSIYGSGYRLVILTRF
jgi:DNA-binding response OmpR family regulator